MAIPLIEDVEQANEDFQKRPLAQSYFAMSESAAWKDLMGRIQAMVVQAQQDHFSSRETKPLKILEEKLRWQQRLFVYQAIEQILDSQLSRRESILEEMKHEHDTDNA